MSYMEEKRARMFSLVEDWRQSGMTQKDFCASHGIKVPTLGYWVARSREKAESESGFIMVERGSVRSKEIEIIYPNGVRLVLDGDLGVISQLIRLY